MRRREFITLLGGAAAAWPLAARAQQPGACVVIGVLMDSPRTMRGQARLRHSGRGCRNLAGPTAAMFTSIIAGRAGEPERVVNMRRNCSRPHRTSSWPRRHDLGPLQQATRTVPIVFTLVPDPVGAGFVENLARPGGNATGFTVFEYRHQRENSWNCSKRSRRA